MRKRHILVLTCLACLCIAMIPYFIGILHINKMKNDLDNPVINSNYQNWRDIRLDNNIAIKLPDTWSLKLEEPLTICDNTGTPVAIGLKTESCSEEQWISLLSNCSNQTVNSYSNDFFSTNRFGNLASVWWAVCEFDSGQEKRIVSLKIPYYQDYYYYFCFMEDSEMRRDEVEAIAYSMSYNK